SACLSCGFLNEGSEKFCGGCGRSLTLAPSPAEPRFTSPEAYTPKHLAEKILTSKAALEGERKQVTVLFADLKGSMELLADRDPEEARRLLGPVLERMMEAVHRYEGTVNQVMGDGIMALFGAPLAHEDPAVRPSYPAVQVRALGPMPVKGLSEPIEVYELLGVGTARSRLQASAARGLTRFVGRDAELETLRRTLDLAGGGHGQLVALVGEPGVGKSRLVWEFSHSHRTQGWLVLASGSVSYGKATSYLPVIDLLKTYGRIEARDDARSIREKVTGKLLTLDRALEPLLPAVLALLDVPVEDPAWEALDPPQRRQRTLEACKRLLLRES